MAKAKPLKLSQLAEDLSKLIVGQQQAIDAIAPIVTVFQAGFATKGRPAGVVLLLGPTGVGKTHTVKALATALHGDSKKLLKIDCAEYQHSHEIGKLIGSPPGYLGHRETQPLFSTARLKQITSDGCALSIVLLDEIEKANDALPRLLLGIADKGSFHNGENQAVSFENTILFLTSNLGSMEIQNSLRPRVGFAAAHDALPHRIEALASSAVRKHFSPEFVNRIDVVVAYEPLSEQSIAAILDRRLNEIGDSIQVRMKEPLTFEVSPSARKFLTRVGVSPEYGARELNRVLQKKLVQPLALLSLNQELKATIRVKLNRAGDGLTFE